MRKLLVGAEYVDRTLLQIAVVRKISIEERRDRPSRAERGASHSSNEIAVGAANNGWICVQRQTATRIEAEMSHEALRLHCAGVADQRRLASGKDQPDRSDSKRV